MGAVHELWVEGEPASQADLGYHALFNYGAYTSFRVEDGGVRGLDLHLARLEASAAELFGEAVGEGRLRDLMQRALGHRASAWLRVSLFSPDIWMREAGWQGRPKVMIGVFDPPPPLATSLRLQVQTYVREAPHLKHTATFGLMRARRAAREAGFDDALFVGGEGRISEGTLWNIGFVSGDRITWPQAPMLAGVTQALLHRGLADVGLSGGTEPLFIGDLDRFEAAFICNSATPACPAAAIGARDLKLRTDVIARLETAWASAPLQTL